MKPTKKNFNFKGTTKFVPKIKFNLWHLLFILLFSSLAINIQNLIYLYNN